MGVTATHIPYMGVTKRLLQPQLICLQEVGRNTWLLRNNACYKLGRLTNILQTLENVGLVAHFRLEPPCNSVTVLLHTYKHNKLQESKSP